MFWVRTSSCHVSSVWIVIDRLYYHFGRCGSSTAAYTRKFLIRAGVCLGAQHGKEHLNRVVAFTAWGMLTGERVGRADFLQEVRLPDLFVSHSLIVSNHRKRMINSEFILTRSTSCRESL
jgi:hypothetical protein